MALLFAYVVAPGEAASGISAVLSAVSLPVAAMIAIAIFFRSDKVQARKTSRSAQHSGTFGA
jgi:uncharacterized membrane protein YciS (DUF1049 family)